MFVPLHIIDYAVLALFLGTLLAIGAAMRRPSQTTSEFFLAGKSLSAVPAGLSLTATVLPAYGALGAMLLGLSYGGLPGLAYDVGLKLLLIPLALWLAMPVVHQFVLPLYQGLELTSVYEYLELRFDRRTRSLASVVFLGWRLLWVAGLLALGCHVLVSAGGLRMPAWVLIVLLGGVATTYTFLGGMKATVWAEVFQLAVMAAAAVVVVMSIWMALDGGAARVWNVAESLERNQTLEPAADGRLLRFGWGLIPHAMLAWLAFFVADQVTLQRLLSVRDTKAARRALLISCSSLTVAVLLLMYVGLGLLAFYHDHADGLRAKWVTNVDPATRRSLVSEEAGRRPLDWDDPASRVDARNIRALVDQRRVIRPNSRQAIEDADVLLDDGAVEGLEVEKLLTRFPPKPSMRHGEVVLHLRANDELLPWYVTTRLAWGLVGLAVAAFLAAIMSSLDAGLLALGGMVLADPGLSLGWGAAPQGSDSRGPIAVVALGLAVTAGALGIALAADLFGVILLLTGTLGGPLLAIFLLGIFTRRANPTGARIGLIAGIGLTGWLAGSNAIESLAWAWPAAQPIGASWALTAGVTLTLISGYAASLCLGAASPPDQLRGLVWRLGRLGQRDAEVVQKIHLPQAKRWK